MALVLEHLGDHWLALGFLLLGLVWWLAPVVLGRSFWWFPGVLGPVVLMLVATGGLIDIELGGYAWWELSALFSLGAIFVLGLLFLLVLVTGQWWAPGGYALGALVLLGVG